MRSVLVVLLFAAAAAPAADETCKYVDKRGRVTYANVPLKGAKKLRCFEPVPVPATPAHLNVLPRPARPAAPVVPKVNARAPRPCERDASRVV